MKFTDFLLSFCGQFDLYLRCPNGLSFGKGKRHLTDKWFVSLAGRRPRHCGRRSHEHFFMERSPTFQCQVSGDGRVSHRSKKSGAGLANQWLWPLFGPTRRRLWCSWQPPQMARKSLAPKPDLCPRSHSKNRCGNLQKYGRFQNGHRGKRVSIKVSPFSIQYQIV